MSRRIPLVLRFMAIVTAAFAAATAVAETPLSSLAGIYDGNQTELAAQLLLGADGRFQYDLSYGAVDETASGTWTDDAEGLVLNSDPVSAPAFELLESKPGSGAALDISLDVPGGLPIQLFSAQIFFSDESVSHEEFEDEHLRIKPVHGKTVTGVELLFPVYMISSEKFAVPANVASMHFRFEPNELGKVAFDHQVLNRVGGDFLLPRYDRVLRFTKRQPDN